MLLAAEIHGRTHCRCDSQLQLLQKLGALHHGACICCNPAELQRPASWKVCGKAAVMLHRTQLFSLQLHQLPVRRK